MARRKVKNSEKSPWGQCLTRPVPNCRGRSGFWLVPENFCVFLPNQKPERRRPFGTGLVRHCPQGLFSPFFSFLRAIFSRLFRLSLAPTICPWVSKDALDILNCVVPKKISTLHPWQVFRFGPPLPHTFPANHFGDLLSFTVSSDLPWGVHGYFQQQIFFKVIYNNIIQNQGNWNTCI